MWMPRGHGFILRGRGFSKSWASRPCRQTFWEALALHPKPARKPADDVVCHASAWSIDFKDDLRVKALSRAGLREGISSPSTMNWATIFTSEPTTLCRRSFREWGERRIPRKRSAGHHRRCRLRPSILKQNWSDRYRCRRALGGIFPLPAPSAALRQGGFPAVWIAD